MFNSKIHGLDGVAAMKAKIRRMENKIPMELDRAGTMEMEIETKEVRARVPVDTGDLKATVTLQGPFRRGRTVWWLITAGGTAAPHGLIVHEDLDAHHDVGQAKYIESVILESAPHMSQRIGNRIDLNRVISEG